MSRPGWRNRPKLSVGFHALDTGVGLVALAVVGGLTAGNVDHQQVQSRHGRLPRTAGPLYNVILLVSRQVRCERHETRLAAR